MSGRVKKQRVAAWTIQPGDGLTPAQAASLRLLGSASLIPALSPRTPQCESGGWEAEPNKPGDAET